MPKGYYRKYGKGYVCPVCGTVYQHPWDKKLAMNCCADKKPLSETAVREAESILEGVYQSQIELVDKLLSGLDTKKEPVKRKPRQPRVKRQYDKAVAKAANRYHKMQLSRIEAALTELEIFEDEAHKSGERTPLQRMAYAYYLRNWDMLKAAAEDFAEQRAIRRLKHFVQRMIDDMILESDVNPDAYQYSNS